MGRIKKISLFCPNDLKTTCSTKHESFAFAATIILQQIRIVNAIVREPVQLQLLTNAALENGKSGIPGRLFGKFDVLTIHIYLFFQKEHD